MTAAVRDLHACYPGEYLTDVRSSCSEIWENNPYLTPLSDNDPDVTQIECHYPLINRSNQEPWHFIHGYIQHLNEVLSVNIRPTEFKGDIHLSEQEKAWYSQVHEIVGRDVPFWIIVSGGKFDYTTKWWETERYQEVINYFLGQILFVQVGDLSHRHPPLEGVLDLRGKTDLRQLIRLVYHSDGVLCPVTSLMHFAAAIDSKHPNRGRRACVVVAGGREPAHWEAYPGHQFLHTIGALRCCAFGGCWKSTVGGVDADSCKETIGNLPRCMDLIQSKHVIQAISQYYKGGALRVLSPKERSAINNVISQFKRQTSRPRHKPVIEFGIRRTTGRAKVELKDPLSENNACERSERFIETLEDYPGGFSGSGIVICGGGVRLFTNAWVCIRALRNLGCKLPIDLWHLGPTEMDEHMTALLHGYDVRVVDAHEIRKNHPTRILNGWELKCFAIMRSSFRDVLLLDADNVPVKDPSCLFETAEYKKTGAVFWPDYGRLEPTRKIFTLCNVAYVDEPEFETGQILVDKSKVWRALRLAMWYNEHSDFFYNYIHGDKETFHIAFRKLDIAYSMPSRGIHTLTGTMCQHDFQGKRIFQHRNMDKWTLSGNNIRVSDFLFEEECLKWVAELRSRWDGRVDGVVPKVRQHEETRKELENTTYHYHRIGYDARTIELAERGLIGEGAARCEVFWDVEMEKNGSRYIIIRSEVDVTCRLKEIEKGIWRGRWLNYERMEVELRRIW
jgi:hypothetical protein